ncbi:hypothetical protein M3J09_008216 [Ascochyta lentis]
MTTHYLLQDAAWLSQQTWVLTLLYLEWLGVIGCKEGRRTNI